MEERKKLKLYGTILTHCGMNATLQGLIEYLKNELITAASKSDIKINNFKKNRKSRIKTLEKKNGKNNNCTDTSSDKLKKLHMAKNQTTLREKLNLF